MKIGDKVKVIGCTQYDHFIELGTIVEIVKIDNSAIKVQTLMNDMWSHIWVPIEDLESTLKASTLKASTIVEYYKAYQSYLYINDLRDDTDSITVDQLVDFVENHILNG